MEMTVNLWISTQKSVDFTGNLRISHKSKDFMNSKDFTDRSYNPHTNFEIQENEKDLRNYCLTIVRKIRQATTIPINTNNSEVINPTRNYMCKTIELYEVFRPN